MRDVLLSWFPVIAFVGIICSFLCRACVDGAQRTGSSLGRCEEACTTNFDKKAEGFLALGKCWCTDEDFDVATPLKPQWEKDRNL